MLSCSVLFFFFKQKTAYEMRISDWSSDVCSSDLLGGAPANEDCAQLGHTPDFERLNRLEVAAYRAAVIARCGPPPDGCALISITNRPDFGIYRTLGLRIDADAFRRNPSVAAYAEKIGRAHV